MFIGRDPIGLLGGNNVFQYAPNPIHWVDVLGYVFILYRSVKIGMKDERNIFQQIRQESLNQGRLFSKMKVITKNLSHNEAHFIKSALKKLSITRKNKKNTPKTRHILKGQPYSQVNVA